MLSRIESLLVYVEGFHLSFDPLTVVTLDGHDRDWYLIVLELTCCVTVVS